MKRLFFYATLYAISLTAPAQSVFAQALPPLPIQLIPDNIRNPGRPGGRRRGGGSRGECLSNNIPLSALSYADSQTVSELGVERTEETVGTLTTKARPTLWFYLPSELTDETITAFVLKDAQETVVYEGQLSGETEKGGIVRVPVAADLELGTAYHWFLTLECGDGEQAVVDGWIERVSVSAEMQKRFEPVGDRNRAALYASYGFLQDALTELAELKLEQPNNDAIDQDWESFLNVLGLSDLTSARLLDCCQITNSTVVEDPRALEPEEAIVPEEEAPAEKNLLIEPQIIEPQVIEPQDTRTILQRARDRG